MKAKVDLHVHSSCSDGILSPKEIIDEAKKNGVSVIAIADHDTVEAYSEELFDYAKINDIKLISAVEISTKLKKVGLHVLGYNIDLKSELLLKRLHSLRNARHNYLNNVGEKLKELGYALNIEELDKIDAVTKTHIALDVVSNEKNSELLLKEFGHIPEKGEFIETIMNEGCPAYVLKGSITPMEAAELIRSVGGKVVLAHPVACKYEDNLTSEETLKIVKNMRADGIEANYIYIDRNNNKINEIKYWNDFAKENNLKTTSGSDFHVDDGIHPIIGLLNEDINLSNDEVDEIVKWLEEN